MYANVDQCPSDPDKRIPGTCGYGVSDADEDGSGIADCNDPKFNSVPNAPTVTNLGRKLTVTMDDASSAATFRIVVYSGTPSRSRVIKTVKTANNPASFTLAVSKRTKAFVRYQVTLAGVTTRLSEPSSSFTASLTRKAQIEQSS